MKFQDEGPQLRRRFASRAASTSTSTSSRSQKAAVLVRRQKYPPETIDEQVLPSLVSSSMSNQQPVVFRDFVLTAFPRWFGLNRYRVHVTWASYVAERLGKNPALDAAVYCITCAFMGQWNDDVKLKESSWEMYSKALSLLRDSIKDEVAMRSRDSVSTSILLSLFEAYSRTNQDSWARHAGGAALMMALRGPNSHVDGFDRCLYMSFRSFLIAQALVEGKPCIFEKPEWQALIDRIRKEDMADPRLDEPISVFIDISDRLFMEIAKFPGVVSEARTLLASPLAHPHKKKLLAARIFNSREATLSLAAEMRRALAAHGYVSRGGTKTPFIGPIPSSFPESFANCLLRGTDTAVKVLNLLLVELANSNLTSIDAAGAPVSMSSTAWRIEDITEPAAGRKSFHIVSGIHGVRGDGSSTVPRVNEWLDLVASSMGMEGMRVVYDLHKTQDCEPVMLSLR